LEQRVALTSVRVAGLAVAAGLAGALLLTRGLGVVGMAIGLVALAFPVLWLPPVRVAQLMIIGGTLAGTFRRGIDELGHQDMGVAVFVAISFVGLIAAVRGIGAWHGRPATRLDRVMMVACAWAVVGGLLGMAASGFASIIGAPVFLLPLCWYWFGRTLLDEADLRTVLGTTLVVASGVAVMGLLQGAGYFLPFDRAWASGVEFTSLTLKGQLRAFGTLQSPAEYSRVLMVGFLLAATLPLRSGGAWVLARFVAVPMFVAAIWFSGVRGAVVLGALALLVMLVVAARLSAATRAVFLVGLLLGGFALMSAQAEEITSRDGATDSRQAAVSRQVSGLQDPFNAQTSSVDAHVNGTVAALQGTFDQPLGLGSGALTRIGQRLGGGRAGDGDLARLSLSWGLPGVLIYGAAVLAVFAMTARVARDRSHPLGHLGLGLAVALVFQWFNPGLYVVNSFFWMTIGAYGAMDAARRRRTAPASADETAEPVARGVATT
jgi:hypothetical protein